MIVVVGVVYVTFTPNISQTALWNTSLESTDLVHLFTVMGTERLSELVEQNYLPHHLTHN